jgi:hypothetical protein
MTLDLFQLTISHEKAQSPVDLLADLESDELLPDTEALSAVRAILHKYIYISKTEIDLLFAKLTIIQISKARSLLHA